MTPWHAMALHWGSRLGSQALTREQVVELRIQTHGSRERILMRNREHNTQFHHGPKHAAQRSFKAYSRDPSKFPCLGIAVGFAKFEAGWTPRKSHGLTYSWWLHFKSASLWSPLSFSIHAGLGVVPSEISDSCGN